MIRHFPLAENSEIKVAIPFLFALAVIPRDFGAFNSSLNVLSSTEAVFEAEAEIICAIRVAQSAIARGMKRIGVTPSKVRR
jgi:hypothetical protein